MSHEVVVTLRIPLGPGRYGEVRLPLEALKSTDGWQNEPADQPAENFRRWFGDALTGLATGGTVRQSPSVPSVDCRTADEGPSGASRGGPSDDDEAEAVEELRAPVDDQGMSLAEARAYWSLQVAELDELLAPLKSREQRIKDCILDTHKDRFEGGEDGQSLIRIRTLRLDTRAARAPLFQALMGLQPRLGPLRQKRTEANREVKSLDLRIKAEAALKAREAKRSRQRSAGR